MLMTMLKIHMVISTIITLIGAIGVLKTIANISRGGTHPNSEINDTSNLLLGLPIPVQVIVIILALILFWILWPIMVIIGKNKEG